MEALQVGSEWGDFLYLVKMRMADRYFETIVSERATALFILNRK